MVMPMVGGVEEVMVMSKVGGEVVNAMSMVGGEVLMVMAGGRSGNVNGRGQKWRWQR